MKPLHLLFTAAALLSGTLPLSLRAQVPLPPFDLALTLNDGVSATAYRGWPMLFRGDAVLMRNVAAPFPLDLNSLTLAIAPAQGPALPWPLRRVTQFAAAPTLGLANDSVRVVWLLTAEETVGLVPGEYTATFSWAGRSAQAVKFSIAPSPGTLPDNDEIRRAVLQSQTALYLDDNGAIAALVPAEARYPESIPLLVQRAKAHVQRAEYREALLATHRARAIFDRTFPDAEHPPAGIIQVENKARAELFKTRTLGPRLPGGPGAAAAPTGPLPSYAVVAGTSAPATAPTAAPVVRAVAATVPTPTPPAVVSPTNPAPTAVALVPPAAAIPASTGTTASIGNVVPSTELVDAKILADAAGQWAATATAKTQYDRNQYSAARATGAPNVPVAGNSPEAWCPSTRDQGMDWLELTFAKPVQAIEVRVRQNDAPGAITKIEALESDGTVHVWWEGVDPHQRSAVREIVWFAVRVPKTSYLVARVKLTLNLASGPGYKEVDAVQLVAAP
jgi:hypothetical protein